MRNFLPPLFIFIGSVLLFAATPSQTPEQMQQELQKADERLIATALVGFRTPRETFQTYWESVKRIDASEYQCMTQSCLVQIFPTAPLTPQGKVRIIAGRQSLTERNHQLVKFTYISDPQKPKIVVIYSLERTIDGQATPFLFIEKHSLVRTAEGWKMDSLEQEHADY